MFHASILQIQEELNYHQQQQEQLEKELYELKAFQSYGDQAFNCVQDALSNIPDKYVDAFKESLLSLFDNQPTTQHNDDDDIEYLEEGDPNYQSIEDIEKEEPENIVVYPYEVKDKEKPKEKTYFELHGRPDLRPETYEDLTPNITYSSSGRAYIGFNDYQEAKEFRERLSPPSMISEAEIMNNHKWEVKFYADLDYVKQIQKDFEDDFTEEQKEQLDFQERLIRPAPDIFYDPKDNVCYVGFSNKERANNYGALLKEVHEFTTDYHVTNPTVVTNCKYELQFMCSKDNAIRLAPLNLKKELDHPSNQSIVNQWVKKKLPVVSNKGYPKVEISELEIADVIARSPNGKAFFEVDSVRKEDGEPFAYCKCIKHPIFPGHVGEMFSFKEVYLVSRGEDIREVS